MKTLIFLALVSFGSLGVLLGPQLDASCCRLVASIKSPASLEVAVTNVQEMPVLPIESSPLRDLRIRVIAASGKEAELTRFGVKLRADPVGAGGSVKGGVLGKGESLIQVLDLREIYVLPAGAYSVTVARNVSIVPGKWIELKTEATFTIQ